MSAPTFVTTDHTRSLFSQAMSAMYQKEVPQYGTLLALVKAVNTAVLEADTGLRERLARNDQLDRLDVERHGAIRVGTAQELNTLRRLFAVMGMAAVGYYDLAVAGVPVHSTAFRPIDEDALARNPFRVFTSLLRLELIEDAALRTQAEHVLAARQIFTPGCLSAIDAFESQGGLTAEQAQTFVTEALYTFQWHSEATVDEATYNALRQAHPLVADVVCFKGPHINHLTPRTLDIDEAQRAMPQHGITAKATIEGPPRRACPILLRQTSFMALKEPILFAGQADGAASGTHTARFGEIEQRGVALTRAGRALYDALLQEAREQAKGADKATYAEVHDRALATVFTRFPDSLDEMRAQGLAFFYTRAATPAATTTPAVHATSIDELARLGYLSFEPITYEDFLPVSAAGIFQSNLGSEDRGAGYEASANQSAFEQALGAKVEDEVALYAQLARDSRREAMTALGLAPEAFADTNG